MRNSCTARESVHLLWWGAPQPLMDPDLPVAFVGTYPPRRCGIATFTHDLSAATVAANPGVSPMILAMTDSGGQYEYPPEVKYEIRQGVRADYARAAEFVNYSHARLVSLQHEYGIFGGDDGAYILDFLGALRLPALVTLHTVLRQPSESQKAIVHKMARRSAGLVVMSGIARDLLASAYGVEGRKVHVIPHGIPDLPPRNPHTLKARFGVTGQRMILTFGLLSPGKGIETVLRALPAVCAKFPDVVYFVVGATHPVIARRDGEAYRTTLEQEAERLGIRDQVVFRDQFIAAEELGNYLQATDVFISPYLNEAQVTSGALSLAMGAGAAVLSTPYWHAQELLANGRGRLFPFRDSEALSRTLIDLFSAPEDLARMKAGAIEHTRSMIWPEIGKAYLNLGLEAMAQSASQPARKSPRASGLPELRLDHLRRMTDDTGILQHATYSVPARHSGYCVDDNARALIVALHADRVLDSTHTRRLITTYLGYLLHSQEEDGHFRNFMSYGRVFDQGPSSDDCLGRAIWALGATVQMAADPGCRRLAKQMLERALKRSLDLGPRGTALTILGLTHVLAEPNAHEYRNTLAALEAKLVKRYHECSDIDWRWFEPTLTYDNAILPLALFSAHRCTGERASLRVARESLEFLEEVCFVHDQLILVGNTGWHVRGGNKSDADEQAIDATAFVLAFRGAYRATGDHHYLQRMRQAFAWFLGNNRLGLPLYDSATGGCCDGLGKAQLNENQGAESTICFLMALLDMLELAGEGLEYADYPLPASA